MKTSELTGAALDWAVSRCEGHESRCSWMLEKEGYAAWQAYEMAWGNPLPNYSTNWAQGGPIIDREEISIVKVGRSIDDAMAPHPECWCAHKDGLYSRYSETPLVSAMRCYVASKLGNAVELPAELLGD